MNKHFILQGSIVPLITPLDKHEELDVAAVEKLVHFHVSKGTNAIFLLGTCGEGPSLTDAVKVQLIDTVLGMEEKLPVIVGLAETATKRTVELAGKLQRERIAAYVLLPPVFQFAGTVEEHLLHIRSVQKVLKSPLILYNLPKKNGGQLIPIEVVRILVEENLIIGIKDSSGDLDYIKKLLQIREAYPSFRVINGELRTAMDALKMGVDGLVMSYTNVDPVGCLELIQAVRLGKSERAHELQKEFLDRWSAFPPGVSFIAKVKSILNAKGLCQNYCCMPTISSTKVGKEQA